MNPHSLIDDIRYKSVCFDFNFEAIELTGSDVQLFLHRQTTQNFEKLPNQEFTWASFLDPQGRILSYFLALKSLDKTILLFDGSFKEAILHKLNTFIVSEDVNFQELGITNVSIRVGAQVKPTHDQYFSALMFSEPSVISLNALVKTTNYQDYKIWEKFQGIPSLKPENFKEEIINNHRLFECALDLKKGCFPGQETVSKIFNNRGAAFYPVLLNSQEKIEDPILLKDERKIGERSDLLLVDKGYLYQAKIIRDFRVHNLELDFKSNNELIKGTVLYYPFYQTEPKLKSQECYDRAVKLSQQNQNEQALSWLEIARELDPTNPDVYEIKGVIFGQLAQLDEAIKVMKELLEVQPDSIMAHTNLSLFFMKQGKIEEAEDHKAKATLATFLNLGKQAQEKKKKQSLVEEKKQKQLDRKKMFEQVLEIDPEDSLALFGMADFYFEEQNYTLCLEYVERVLASDPKYSTAYLLKSKALLADNNKEKAKETLKMGILIAGQKGDLMPANEMQSLLLDC
jgi:folate-binding protein YgfZ